VLKPAVRGGGKDVVYQPSLFYSLKPLQHGRVYHRDFVLGEKLIPQNGVIENFGTLWRYEFVVLKQPTHERVDTLFKSFGVCFGSHLDRPS
jgi:hypothetical protein